MLPARSHNALVFLTSLASNPFGSVRSLQEIAAKENLPHAYMEQILPDLRRAGFIKAHRGAFGGYKLVKDPKDIRLLDVVNAVEKSDTRQQVISRYENLDAKTLPSHTMKLLSHLRAISTHCQNELTTKTVACFLSS
jgi:Rrf2 family protein